MSLIKAAAAVGCLLACAAAPASGGHGPKEGHSIHAAAFALGLRRMRLAFPFVSLLRREAEGRAQPEAVLEETARAPVVLAIAPGVRCTVSFEHRTARRLLEISDERLARRLGSERPLEPLDLDYGPGLDEAQILERTLRECAQLVGPGEEMPAAAVQVEAPPEQPQEVHRGVLLEHGEAARLIRGTPIAGCYCVDLAVPPRGASRRIWGNDLRLKLQRAQVRLGDEVELKLVGTQRVRISETRPDGSRSLREVNKRIWEVQVLQRTSS